MAHKALKAFDYSHDGINSRRAEEGDELTDLPPANIAGLIAEGFIAPEVASKIAGETMLSGDLSGQVDSDKAVKEEAASARSRISDGKIGEPEAASIIEAHALTENSDPAVIAAAQAEKDAHEAGDADFDPKSPEAIAAAKKKAAEDDKKS